MGVILIFYETSKNFYDITVDDFKVIGVEGIQKLSQKLEIAI